MEYPLFIQSSPRRINNSVYQYRTEELVHVLILRKTSCLFFLQGVSKRISDSPTRRVHIAGTSGLLLSLKLFSGCSRVHLFLALVTTVTEILLLYLLYLRGNRQFPCIKIKNDTKSRNLGLNEKFAKKISKTKWIVHVSKP
ncbi:hypothetical protein Gasu2_25550 [Galdieria sulphuraria]|nr:hypothetical protein Gasu2_25550 [Galdieria sulphuraria]